MKDEIEELFARFGAAWDAHDAAAMAACWSADGNAVDPWGRYAIGQANVETLLAGEHAQAMAASSYEILSTDVRELSPTSAVVECEAIIHGVRAPNGRAYDLKHRVDAVCVRTDDGWHFLSLHPTPHA